ncbi:hypothetical protein ABBQ32_004233 [Trebouxia sp. C0010 RCD-2024]
MLQPQTWFRSHSITLTSVLCPLHRRRDAKAYCNDYAQVLVSVAMFRALSSCTTTSKPTSPVAHLSIGSSCFKIYVINVTPWYTKSEMMCPAEIFSCCGVSIPFCYRP